MTIPSSNGAGTLRPSPKKIKQKIRVGTPPVRKASDYRPSSQADLDRIATINATFRSLKGGE